MNGMSTIDRGSTEDLLELRGLEQHESIETKDAEERTANDNAEPNEFEMTEEELIQKRTMEAIVKLGQLRQANARNDNLA